MDREHLLADLEYIRTRLSISLDKLAKSKLTERTNTARDLRFDLELAEGHVAKLIAEMTP